MIVFYDAVTGAVSFTAKGEGSLPIMETMAHIIVPDDTNLGELRGWSVIDGELVLSDLEPMKAFASQEINQISGLARSATITDIPGQEMVYLRKEEEAKSYILDTAPDMNMYPMLQAEVGITAPDAYSLAQLWLNMSMLWRQQAAYLENLRMQALIAVAYAQTREDVNLVLNNYRQALS